MNKRKEKKEGECNMKRRKFTKIALMLSLCLMVVWSLLGIGATIAWFTDTTPVARNSFVIGELDLKVSYKNDIVTEYTPVEREKSIFKDEALYEPGYTQVVYLKIENTGDIAFDEKISVDKNYCSESINVYGAKFYLSEYLRFGVVFGESEEELERILATREDAREEADQEMVALRLNTYSELDTVTLEPGETRYAALIVFMPEEVDNAANYRGSVIPEVKLGITVYAQQAGTPMQ